MRTSAFRLAAVAVVLLAAGCFVIALAYGPQTGQNGAATDKSAPSPLKVEAVTLMRIINTAEVSYRHDYGHFDTWDILFDHGYIERFGASLEKKYSLIYSKEPEVLPNLDLALVVSPAEDTYSVAIHDKVREDKLYSFFSDPNGLIYEGQPPQNQITDADHLTLVNLVRTINVAEVSYDAKYSRFDTFDVLKNAGLFASYEQSANVTLGKYPEVLPNLELSVLVSPTQDTWAVALHDKAKDHKLYSVFSDPTGIIYEAQPLQ